MNVVLLQAIALLVRLVSPELIRKAVDAGLAVVEEFAKTSTNRFDDAILLPICATIRTALDVPRVELMGSNGADEAEQMIRQNYSDPAIQEMLSRSEG